MGSSDYITGTNARQGKEQQQHRWRIMSVTSTSAKLLGYVYAPDEETVLKVAIAQLHIEKLWRNRLMAIRET
jgi:hypothetical protein